MAMTNAERQRRWRERHRVVRACPGLPSAGGCGAELRSSGGRPPSLCAGCKAEAERVGLARMGPQLLAEVARRLA